MEIKNLKNVITPVKDNILVVINLKALADAIETNTVEKKSKIDYGSEYEYLVEKIKAGNVECIHKALVMIAKSMSKKGYANYTYYGAVK